MISFLLLSGGYSAEKGQKEADSIDGLTNELCRTFFSASG